MSHVIFILNRTSMGRNVQWLWFSVYWFRNYSNGNVMHLLTSIDAIFWRLLTSIDVHGYAKMTLDVMLTSKIYNWRQLMSIDVIWRQLTLYVPGTIVFGHKMTCTFPSASDLVRKIHHRWHPLFIHYQKQLTKPWMY